MRLFKIGTDESSYITANSTVINQYIATRYKDAYSNFPFMHNLIANCDKDNVYENINGFNM